MKVSPTSTSVVEKVPTVAFAALFSAMVLELRLMSVGASFTDVRLIVTVAAGEEDRPLSEAVTVNVLAPFSLAAGT